MAAAPDDGVVAIGGSVTAGDSAWRFAGATWQPLAPGGPVNRNMIAAAFDSRRKVVVAFGGVGSRNGSRYGETWEWNGRAWEERDLRGPGARDHHAMAYDEARGQVVMYGGLNADHKTLQSDTWTWDGVVWTRAEEQSGPGGIAHHAMAYDSKRQRVVLYGGITDNGPATDDVWEWDGKTWQRITSDGAAGPGRRSHIKLAYDAQRDVVVMFGGNVPGAGPTGPTLTDTWTWDGRGWMRVSTGGPAARYLHAMAYDTRRQRVVMTAGNRAVRPYDVLADTWEWDGSSWTEVQPPSGAERVRLLYEQGVAFTNARDLPRAVDVLSEAVRLDPTHARAYRLRGYVYWRQRLLDLAMADTEAALRLEPRMAMVYYSRGLVYSLREGLDRAIAEVTRAHEIEPDNPVFLTTRCRMRDAAGRDRELALADCNRALELRPRHADTHEYRGRVLLNAGRIKEALADFDLALTLDASLVSARYGRGLALVRLERTAKGRADMDAAVAKDNSVAQLFVTPRRTY